LRRATRVLFVLSFLTAGIVLADTPPNTPPTIPRPAAVGSIHINSVRVQGNWGEAARFVVEIQNNLNRVARLGTVFIGSANSPGNRPSNPRGDFRNLAPGARVTLTLTSPWRLQCVTKEGGPECFEVGVVMEPDAAANGEVWDGVWHRVCSRIPKAGQTSGPVVFTDTTFRH
jgi:hypothetical protein